nr:hypothetical protein [Tanacetum cinerariifolium]
KLCLDYEVKKGNKVVKKELIVALRGELYFFKFIINPKEEDMEPEVILGRSFMRLVNGIGDFGSEPFVCKMGKSSRTKKRAIENLNLFYQDIGRHLTQKEAVKEALELRISQRFALLEEIRLVLEINNDKYKKVLSESLKEEDDPEAFIFPIRFEGKVNKNALVDTGLDINTMPYRVYEKLGREEIKKVGATTLIAKFLILDIPTDLDAPIVVGRGFLYTIGGIVNTPERLFLTFDGICHQTSHLNTSTLRELIDSEGRLIPEAPQPGVPRVAIPRP